jgi:hypothetical protein
MNTSVLATSILGTFGRPAGRPSALPYDRAVIFTLNQDSITETNVGVKITRVKARLAARTKEESGHGI